MKIKLLAIGKTASPYLEEGITVYLNRLIHYADFSFDIIPDVKSAGTMEVNKLKDLEAQSYLKRITTRDYVILLDENGKRFTSEAFAVQLNKWQSTGDKNLVFVIGGAFGFGEALKARANQSIALSDMTFSHQMVRLIFVEQLYRAFTILKGEGYHHK